MKEKRIDLYDEQIKDSFISYNMNINNIEVRKEKDKKHILLKKEDHQIVMALDNENRMISYYNDLIFHIEDNFLRNNKYLKSIYMDNVVLIENSFMEKNIDLKYIYVPYLEEVGNDFLSHNDNLKCLELPSLKRFGFFFLQRNKHLKELKVSHLKEMGKCYLIQNKVLDMLEIPEDISNQFIYNSSFKNNFRHSEKKLVLTKS